MLIKENIKCFVIYIEEIEEKETDERVSQRLYKKIPDIKE